MELSWDCNQNGNVSRNDCDSGNISVAMLTLRVCNRGSAIRWNRQILLTALATAGQTICFFLANKYTTVANTIVLQYCSPIFVLFYYRIFQKRRLKCQQIISVAVCSAGILIFFAGQINTGMMLGNILALASGIMFGGQFYLGAMEDNDPGICEFVFADYMYSDYRNICGLFCT